MHWVTAIINLAEFTDLCGLYPGDYVVAGSMALRLRGYANIEPKDLDVAFTPVLKQALTDSGMLHPDKETGRKLVNEEYHIDAGGLDDRVSWDFSTFFGWSTKLDPSDPKSPYVLTDDGLLEFYKQIVNNCGDLPKDKLAKYVGRVQLIEDFQALRRLAKKWAEDTLPAYWKE